MLPSVNDNVVFFKSAHDYAVRENSQEISYIRSYQKILYSFAILFVANDFPTDDGKHEREIGQVANMLQVNRIDITRK